MIGISSCNIFASPNKIKKLNAWRVLFLSIYSPADSLLWGCWCPAGVVCSGSPGLRSSAGSPYAAPRSEEPGCFSLCAGMTSRPPHHPSADGTESVTWSEQPVWALLNSARIHRHNNNCYRSKTLTTIYKLHFINGLTNQKPGLEMCFIKGVMNWEIKIPLIFWHIHSLATYLSSTGLDPLLSSELP